ncbi:polysaccharide lyase 8 family protein [Streptomyces sp. NBC_00669]|uniref:polysaccharide lyase 8 family protein n=1 Tax=Streptomyces sp. NBC_00669 TaxID=2976011 RepID=UPI002E32C894|nr:polysaccharide lyase 8 family protein [Streptomyces sp. NBC_00669]
MRSDLPPSRSHASRRTVLAGLAGAGAAAVLGPLTPAPAVAADDPFESLLARAETLITGGDIDPDDPDFATALRTLDSSAGGLWSTLDRSADRTVLWPDFAPVTDPDMFAQCYTALRTLAVAWATPGTSLTGSQDVADALLAALRFLRERAYDPARAETGNWYQWEIGSPRALLDTCVLLRARLTPDDLAAHLAAVDHFVPNPDRRTNSPTLSETGANRADKSVIVALSGLLSRDADRLVLARDGLSDVRDAGKDSLFQYVAAGDGFYQDGSFVQHDVFAYTGSYGSVLLNSASYLLALLGDSDWQITDRAVSVLYDAVERTFAPFVLDGLMMDPVRGRAISREYSQDFNAGADAVSGILLLAERAPADRAATWRALVKGWISRGQDHPFPRSATIPAIVRAKALTADRGLVPTGPAAAHTVMADMDRVVHRRPTWSFALALSSRRIARYEAGNGENLHGWYTGDGMAYLYTDGDRGQFADGFWPTVNSYRLPGTTVDTRPRADLQSSGTSGDLPANAVAGGAVLAGRYGAAAMELAAEGSTLRARKAWFCLDDAVVALGTGITASDGRRIETVLENRRLPSGASHRLLVDGVPQPERDGWQRDFDHVRWAHLEGVGGYVLPSGAALRALREERTGTWHDLDVGGTTYGSTTPVTNRYATLWFDHGVSPAGATYAYVLLPGADAARTAAWSLARPVRVLSNLPALQAIEDRTAGLLSAHFWSAGEVAGLACDGPGSVLVRRRGTRVSVAVADSGRSAESLAITLPFPVGDVLRADDTVTVTTGRRPVLHVRVGGSRGHTHSAELT